MFQDKQHKRVKCFLHSWNGDSTASFLREIVVGRLNVIHLNIHLQIVTNNFFNAMT